MGAGIWRFRDGVGWCRRRRTKKGDNKMRLRIESSRFTRLRLWIYLLLVLLWGVPYLWMLSRPRFEYTLVTPAGTLVPATQLTLSVPKPVPEFVRRNGQLYLLTARYCREPLRCRARRRPVNTWTESRLRELVTFHPELKSYFHLPPPSSDIISLQLR